MTVPTFPPEELHFSELKQIARSPAHFRAAILEPRASSPAQRFGILAHAATLGGEVILFDGERRGNAWKAFEGIAAGKEFFIFDGTRRGKAWEAAKEEAAGRLIVSTEDVERATPAKTIAEARRIAGKRPAPIVTTAELELAKRIAEAVTNDPVVRANGLLTGAKEVDLKWSLGEQPCGGRVDVLGSDFIADLKTSSSAEDWWFTRQAERLGYHAQLAWYQRGAEENSFSPERLFSIVVEPKAPFAVVCYELTPRTIEEGKRRWWGWWETFCVCRDSGVWPAYTETLLPLEIGHTELIFGDDEDEASSARWDNLPW